MRKLIAKALVLLAVVAGAGAVATAPATADQPAASSNRQFHAYDWHW